MPYAPPSFPGHVHLILRPARLEIAPSRPVFTVTAATTLVLGIAAAVAIFALVNRVLLRPLPYGNPDRLVGAWHDLKGISIRKANQTSATYFTYKKLARSIEGIGVYQSDAVNVSDPRGSTAPQRITSSWTSASLIPVLAVSPLLGRSFTEAEDLPKGPEVVIISEGLWRSRFGADRNAAHRLAPSSSSSFFTICSTTSMSCRSEVMASRSRPKRLM